MSTVGQSLPTFKTTRTIHTTKPRFIHCSSHPLPPLLRALRRSSTRARRRGTIAASPCSAARSLCGDFSHKTPPPRRHRASSLASVNAAARGPGRPHPAAKRPQALPPPSGPPRSPSVAVLFSLLLPEIPRLPSAFSEAGAATLSSAGSCCIRGQLPGRGFVSQ